jgi:tetratricopeptide (TPR) repeat protein
VWVSSEVVSIATVEQSLTDEEKADLAKNRRKEIWLIRTWDYFLSTNQPDEALIRYLEALEKLPGDIVLEKKIAHAYFLKKDFTNSHKYYLEVPFLELKSEEKKEFFQAIVFDESIPDPLVEITTFPISESEREYYTIVSHCLWAIEICAKEVAAYTGTSLEIISLQDALLNAPKISPDIAYRNFSLATAFYLLKEYRVSSEMSRKILVDRGDYFDIQKLRGFSLFELGKYYEARTALAAYLENVPNDLETIVRLSEISTLDKDYVQANLYLNNAINAWYHGKTNLERQLAYNYSALWDTASMIKVLSYLISEPDALEDDFAVAISLAFSRGENARAYVWSMQWLEAFPGSTKLTALYMTALRIIWRGDEVEKFVQTLSWDILATPLVMLERWINHFDSGSYQEAQIFLEEVERADPDSDFGQEATNYLLQVEEKLAPKEDDEESDDGGWW